MKYLLLFSFTIFFSLYACKKNDCKEEQLTATTLESDYGCNATKHNLKISLTDDVAFVRTKTDYDAKVSGACHPQIDFTKFDLIIGKQGLDSKNDTILYSYKRTCPANDLALTFDLVQSTVATHDTIVYHAIVPKISSGENLNVYVNIR
jgi:hypothetical protein